MRYDKNFAFFASHSEWYTFVAGKGYIPTKKAPPKAVEAIEKYNSYRYKKHVKSSNKLAQIMYSNFSLCEIYHAASVGMSLDVCCENETGIPEELTEEEFNNKILHMCDPNKERILSFQKQCNDFNNEFIKKHGVHYDEYREMTETEKYAYMYLSSIWYRN